LPLLREELAMRERCRPRALGISLRLEVHRDEEDLARAVVIEMLDVAHDLARARVAEARRVIGARGIAQEVLEDGHREIAHEEAARCQMVAHAREEALYVVARVEV